MDCCILEAGDEQLMIGALGMRNAWMVLCCKELKNSACLVNCALEEDTVIHLVVRAKSGGALCCKKKQGSFVSARPAIPKA